jgi:hypothetical protein
MKIMIQPIITTLLIACSFCSCKKYDSAVNQPSVKSNLVTGKVTDTRGNLIPGAEIVSEHTVWYNTYLKSITDAGGNYKITLPAEPAGSWSAKAQLSKTAWGQNYIFDLAADRPDPFTAKEGAERNFVWKLSVQRSGSDAYYGAHVDLYQFDVDVPMNEVKLVFTPYPGETTLIDGSPALAIERNIEDVAGTFMVKDIPIGKYSVKAVYPGKTLLLDYRHNSGTPEITKTIVFGKHGFLAATEYNIEFWISE